MIEQCKDFAAKLVLFNEAQRERKVRIAEMRLERIDTIHCELHDQTIKHVVPPLIHKDPYDIKFYSKEL